MFGARPRKRQAPQVEDDIKQAAWVSSTFPTALLAYQPDRTGWRVRAETGSCHVQDKALSLFFFFGRPACLVGS